MPVFKAYDRNLFFSVITLICFGAIILFSASSQLSGTKHTFYFWKHSGKLAVGFLLMIFFSFINLSILKKYSQHIIYFTWGIALFAIFNSGGIWSVKGRSLNLFGMNIFTTSELLKFSLIIYTASFLSDYKNTINDINVLIKYYFPYFFFSLAIIIMQPDFSTLFIIGLINITLIFISGINIRYIISGFSSLGLISIFSYFTIEYVRKRFNGFLFGDLPKQQLESLKAISSGGFFGKGPGQGMAKNGFIPEIHTDFILPVLVEDFGFIGVMFLFGLFCYIFYCGIKILKKQSNTFHLYLGYGIIINFMLYLIINSFYVLALIPPTGLAIPLISHGGSHNIMSLIFFGILLNISKEKQYI